MPERVDLLIEDARWEQIGLAGIAPRALRLALEAARIAPGETEISLLACDDARIATLNSAFRGRPAATNVLSWPAFDLFPATRGGAPACEIPQDPDGVRRLGDIALAYETVTKEAEAAGISADDHVLHLILHACLHLLGYDHQTEADAEIMERLEVAALASVGVATPY